MLISIYKTLLQGVRRQCLGRKVADLVRSVHQYRQYLSVTKNIDFASVDEHPRNSFQHFNHRKCTTQRVDEASKYVYDECLKTDIMIMSVGIDKIRTVMQFLNDLHLDTNAVQKLLIRSPKLITSQNLQDKAKSLLEYGFKPKQVASILQQFPDIVNMDFDILSKSMNILQKLGFSSRQLLMLISSDPEIILIDSKKILVRVTDLKDFFKSRDVLQLIATSPAILTDSMDEISIKFDYVLNDMEVLQPEMLKSNIFSHSLQHIQCRHQFLVRAGLFRKVNRKKGEISKNPPLWEILDTSDKEFAKKHGNMTKLDYQAFEKLFRKEFDENDRDEDE